MESGKLKHVVFYVPLKPGNLMLVEMDNHTLCILRDDVPIQRCWGIDQMSEAVKEFQKMKAQLTVDS